MERLKCEYHPYIEASFIGSLDTTIRFTKVIGEKEHSFPQIYALCTECAGLVVHSEDKEHTFLYAIVR